MANLASTKLPKIVVTRTPLRVSFAGGGTALRAGAAERCVVDLADAVNVVAIHRRTTSA